MVGRLIIDGFDSVTSELELVPHLWCVSVIFITVSLVNEIAK